MFQLLNRKSGRAIDVPNASTAQGTGLIQYTPSSAVNQRFRFIPVGEGLYEIWTTHGGTQLVWDVSGGDSAEGAKIVQWAPKHTSNQQWRIADAGDGYVTITCARSGKALGVTGDATNNGATLEQQTPNWGQGQQWRRIGK
nr:RICIN domain-containing protein [Streptomyces sp. NA04227]